MKKTCFYIGPIGDKNSLTNIWTENILEFLVVPVIKKLGYKNPILTDLVSTPSKISFEVMRHLVEDSLVIADLTEENPAVFYQLAIRHILQKPVIHLIRKGDRVPFDLSEIRVIPVKIDDLNLMESARLELRRFILEIEKGSFNEISYVTKIKQLKDLTANSKSVSDKEMFFNIFEQLDGIRSSIHDLQREVFDLSNQISSSSRKTLRASTFVDKRLAKAELIRRRSTKN